MTHSVSCVSKVSGMRTQCDSFSFSNRVVDWQRLDIKDIETRPSNPFFLQRFNQGSFIYKRPSGCVDEEGCRLHERQVFLSDYTPSFLGEHEMQGHNITLPEKSLFGRHIFYSCVLRTLPCEIWRPSNNSHIE